MFWGSHVCVSQSASGGKEKDVLERESQQCLLFKELQIPDKQSGEGDRKKMESSRRRLTQCIPNPHTLVETLCDAIALISSLVFSRKWPAARSKRCEWLWCRVICRRAVSGDANQTGRASKET